VSAVNESTFIYKKITKSIHRIYLTDGITIINIDNFRQFKASIIKKNKESIVLFYVNETKLIFRMLNIPIKASY